MHSKLHEQSFFAQGVRRSRHRRARTELHRVHVTMLPFIFFPPHFVRPLCAFFFRFIFMLFSWLWPLALVSLYSFHAAAAGCSSMKKASPAHFLLGSSLKMCATCVCIARHSETQIRYSVRFQMNLWKIVCFPLYLRLRWICSLSTHSRHTAYGRALLAFEYSLILLDSDFASLIDAGDRRMRRTHALPMTSLSDMDREGSSTNS